MIKKISISHVDWNRTYEVDVEKGMCKLKGVTMAYGVPLLVAGLNFALLKQMVEPQSVVAYVDLDKTKYVEGAKLGKRISNEVIDLFKRYIDNRMLVEQNKELVARNIVSVFKVN